MVKINNASFDLGVSLRIYYMRLFPRIIIHTHISRLSYLRPESVLIILMLFKKPCLRLYTFRK